MKVIYKLRRIVNILDCGGILTGDLGLFASPNYPSDYSNSLDCEWVIRWVFQFKPRAYVANYNNAFPLRHNISTYHIKVNFETLDIESHSMCRHVLIIK